MSASFLFLLLSLLLLFQRTLAQQRSSAALIIGGYWYNNTDDAILNSVELFGCDGIGEDSISLNNYPVRMYLSSGVYQDNKVINCGGFTCTGDDCTPLDLCYSWNPSDGEWTAAPSLAAVRYNYLMAKVENMHKPEQDMVPLVLGNGLKTEIWDKEVEDWVEHMDLMDPNWYSMGCLVEHDNKIYSVTNAVVELDPGTWTFTSVANTTNPLSQSGRCAVATINGNPGIMTRYGDWFDLVTKSWSKKAAPPLVPVVGLANAMWTYRGRPTVFGNPVCDDMDTGSCLNTKVVQYDPEEDVWEEIGDMLHPRTNHMVIEVPGETCDSFASTVPPEATTTSNTNSGGMADSSIGWMLTLLCLTLLVLLS